MRKLLNFERNFKFEKASEFSIVAAFLLIMSYIYIFPTFFIIVILVLNVVLYIGGSLIYHKVAASALRTDLKRIKTYINIFENIYSAKYNLHNDFQTTINFLAESKRLTKPILEKKIYSKMVTLQNFLLSVALTLNSHASRQVDITNNFTKNLLNNFRG
jgi:hypothetical protein